MRPADLSAGLVSLLSLSGMGQSLRLTTWNLRYDSQPDNITVAETLASLPDPLREPPSFYPEPSHEKPWSTRRIGIAALLEFQSPAVISFQETLIRQVRDLQELLGSDWDFVGVGRDDGKLKGEFSPIFFRKTLVKIGSWDTFWLSDTPFEASKYPGAGSCRICTVAHLSISGKNFTLFNAHFDDQSDPQRRLAASLILYRARYEAATTGEPVFVTGDFNSPAEGEDSGAYKIFSGTHPPVAIDGAFASKYAVPRNSGLSGKFAMHDLRSTTPRSKVSGHFATSTDFAKLGKTTSYERIDFIFGASHVNWQSVAYKVDEALHDDGIYLSDHRPLTVDILLP